MSLLEQINKKRREIKTDGYSMSIGEWTSMYESKVLARASRYSMD